MTQHDLTRTFDLSGQVTLVAGGTELQGKCNYKFAAKIGARFAMKYRDLIIPPQNS